jgi:hypothetical protein
MPITEGERRADDRPGRKRAFAEMPFGPSSRKTVGHPNPLYIRIAVYQVSLTSAWADKMHGRFSLADWQCQFDAKPTFRSKFLSNSIDFGKEKHVCAADLINAIRTYRSILWRPGLAVSYL